MESYENNGILTTIFGPAGWHFMTCAAYGYPLNNPTEDQKRDYKEWYRLIAKILPCKYCRISYENFINNGHTKLTDEVMTNRQTLTKWLYDLHNAVNAKLGIFYGVTLEDVTMRYNSYRSRCTSKPNEKGCTTPLDIKCNSYKLFAVKDCPLVEYSHALRFVRYARLRNLPDSDYYILAKFKEKGAFEKCLKNKLSDDTWCRRNKECKKIIDYMRINGIPSIETEGEWKDYPTIPELRLILRLSSNLPNNELLELINKLQTNKYPQKPVIN